MADVGTKTIVVIVKENITPPYYFEFNVVVINSPPILSEDY
jgi:hypothetical protein